MKLFKGLQIKFFSIKEKKEKRPFTQFKLMSENKVTNRKVNKSKEKPKAENPQQPVSEAKPDLHEKKTDSVNERHGDIIKHFF